MGLACTAASSARAPRPCAAAGTVRPALDGASAAAEEGGSEGWGRRHGEAAVLREDRGEDGAVDARGGPRARLLRAGAQPRQLARRSSAAAQDSRAGGGARLLPGTAVAALGAARAGGGGPALDGGLRGWLSPAHKDGGGGTRGRPGAALAGGQRWAGCYSEAALDGRGGAGGNKMCMG
ncbi:circumsporozoite protein-like [Panicum virgatum]|uniref:circumsporozoite protein-like n=1 Tax=Panicum virgatum TaxID=38727 RepID=UPI0019D5AE1F|nr:circumsporozoite protein-like [Panicum virgatum]